MDLRCWSVVLRSPELKDRGVLVDEEFRSDQRALRPQLRFASTLKVAGFLSQSRIA